MKPALKSFATCISSLVFHNKVKGLESSRKGWSLEEHQVLLESIALFSRGNWYLLSQHITRSEGEVKDYLIKLWWKKNIEVI